MCDWKSTFILNEHCSKYKGQKKESNNEHRKWWIIGAKMIFHVVLCSNSLIKQTSENFISKICWTVFVSAVCLSWVSLVGYSGNEILLFITKFSLKLTQDLYATWLERYLTWSHCKPQGRIDLGTAGYSAWWCLLSWSPSRCFICCFSSSFSIVLASSVSFD